MTFRLSITFDSLEEAQTFRELVSEMGYPSELYTHSEIGLRAVEDRVTTKAVMKVMQAQPTHHFEAEDFAKYFEEIGLRSKSVHPTLGLMAKVGLIERVAHGVYRLKGE